MRELQCIKSVVFEVFKVIRTQYTCSESTDNGTRIRSFVVFVDISNPNFSLHNLFAPSEPTAVASRLRSSQTFPKVLDAQRSFFHTICINHYQHKIIILLLFVFILVLLHVLYLLVLIVVYVCIGHWLIDSFVYMLLICLIIVLIYSATQLQKCF